MDYEWIGEKHLEQKQKNIKNCSHIAVNKKPQAGNQILFTRRFVAPIWNWIEKFHAANALAFWLHFLCRLDQNQGNLTLEIIKMCKQILAKNITGRLRNRL